MKGPIFKIKNKIKPQKAKDGALVYELFKDGKGIKSVGLASGFLDPDRKAFPHFHKVSEEIYYIASGKGKVKAGDSTFIVEAGDAVFIPRNMVHALENTSKREKMHVLCISSPPYKPKDFIFV